MKDRYWLEAWHAACSVLTSTDIVIAPMGDWPVFPCRVRFYVGPFAVQDATVLLLHKGRMAGLNKAELTKVVAGWHGIYGNSVFVVLSATARASSGLSRLLCQFYLRPVSRYLRSRRLKKRSRTIWFVHIPKTGGTSLWQRLRRALPSNIYYTDIESFLANPPSAGDYDLIGLHFTASAALPLLREGDWLIGMVRNPSDRFFSGVMHARRPEEDPAAFNSAMQAMRTMDVADYLRTAAGRIEAHMQLLILGGDHRRSLDSQVEDDMLRNAVALLHRPNALFAPSDQSAQFNYLLSNLFGFRLRRLDALNVNVGYVNHDEEFNQARQALERENQGERRLYEAVCARFAAYCHDQVAP